MFYNLLWHVLLLLMDFVPTLLYRCAINDINVYAISCVSNHISTIDYIIYVKCKEFKFQYMKIIACFA